MPYENESRMLFQFMFASFTSGRLNRQTLVLTSIVYTVAAYAFRMCTWCGDPLYACQLHANSTNLHFQGHAVVHCVVYLTLDVVRILVICLCSQCVRRTITRGLGTWSLWASGLTRLAIKRAPVFRVCATLRESLTLMKATMCGWTW